MSQLTLGFGTNGSVTNYSSVRPHTQEEVLKESSKLVTFVDLCGHERYLKTTVFGLTGAVPAPKTPLVLTRAHLRRRVLFQQVRPSSLAAARPRSNTPTAAPPHCRQHAGSLAHHET